MKGLLMLLSFFVFGSAYAETVQQVEYHLPKGENWVVGKKLESEKGTTIIYLPQGVEKQNAKEFFGVNANRLQGTNDPDLIKMGIAKNFPSMKIDFKVLEQDKDSVTYEWSAQENGVEKVHGWGRAFSTKEGTVVLGYQTEDSSKVAQARSTWVQALKEAKLN
ncbi:MAG: hypothetical protein ACK5MA_04200 [Parachlamydiaceae bacterium]